MYKVKIFNSINEINFNDVDKAIIDKVMWVKVDNPIKSYAQMVFIKDYGFIIKMTAFEINPLRKWYNDNDKIADDSTLEAYLMFDEERYMNLETNANGARKQAIRYNRENKEYIYNNEFNGFEVIPEILKDRWTLTIKLPIDKLLKLYKSLKKEDFKSGFKFKGNFYKVHELRGTPYEHYIAYKEIDWPYPECHRPKQFETFIIE